VNIALERTLPRAWYEASIAEFVAAAPEFVVGVLTASSGLAVVPEQAHAWVQQVTLLQPTVRGIAGSIFLEFNIPRMGTRADVVLLIGKTLFVLEFKVGMDIIERSAMNQVWDYALDLKNFHLGSHHLRIIPIVVATSASEAAGHEPRMAADEVGRPVPVTPAKLRDFLVRQAMQVPNVVMDSARWLAAPYSPTPTIVEAARALFARHSVESIARNDAGAINLKITSSRVEQLVEDARRSGKKTLCFVTGVPGAGKTLVGLNIATHRRDAASETHAVYLSGNGPLVAVLREALTRDEVARLKSEGQGTSKARAANPVKQFIQNVHHFRDEALRTEGPPTEHVVIFDEAQRAWTADKTALFMRQRKGQPNFKMSEPEFLISYMDRHQDWAVVICLVGGGQEIHTGEAGIGEWVRAARNRFSHWELHLSDQLTDQEYVSDGALALLQQSDGIHIERHLHLSVSMRSFRAEHLSQFVKCVLDSDSHAARKALDLLEGRYPLCVTRDLRAAKQWVRQRARGSERYGLMASSKAMRLKPYAIDIRATVDPVQWFLYDADDVRSGLYLEDCATEFQVQGLEVDWACVNWDGDLRRASGTWSCHDFRGNRWERIKKPDRQMYLRNAYRVLLTRARQGMVIFVPPGDTNDATRLPEFYDSTYRFLKEAGIPELA
jgi:hypothetical protein